MRIVGYEMNGALFCEKHPPDVSVGEFSEWGRLVWDIDETPTLGTCDAQLSDGTWCNEIIEQRLIPEEMN